MRYNFPMLLWLSTSIAVFITAELLPGFEVKGIKGAAIAAAILGLLQWLFGGVLFALVGIGTLGLGFLLAPLTNWVVTTVLLIVADKASTNLKIKDIPTALIGALVITALASGIGYVGGLLT